MVSWLPVSYLFLPLVSGMVRCFVINPACCQWSAGVALRKAEVMKDVRVVSTRSPENRSVCGSTKRTIVLPLLSDWILSRTFYKHIVWFVHWLDINGNWMDISVSDSITIVNNGYCEMNAEAKK